MTMITEVISESTVQTRAFGKKLGRFARSGDVILLVGDLGAGKTTFTQGIAAGMGVQTTVRSPTFVMVSEHSGQVPLYHIDLYRIEGIAEALDLGIEEYTSGEGVCVVEWGDRAISAFPEGFLIVYLEDIGGSSRRLTFDATQLQNHRLLSSIR
jgi:tRNA threonylcarbamoyladenosine biosynthesis protein TsaE